MWTFPCSWWLNHRQGQDCRPFPVDCWPLLPACSHGSPSAPQTRQLVKDGFLVELSEGSRKLRHVFLFTDVLLCAKLKKTAVG